MSQYEALVLQIEWDELTRIIQGSFSPAWCEGASALLSQNDDEL